jgi:hypothetical protein
MMTFMLGYITLLSSLEFFRENFSGLTSNFRLKLDAVCGVPSPDVGHPLPSMGEGVRADHRFYGENCCGLTPLAAKGNNSWSI